MCYYNTLYCCKTTVFLDHDTRAGIFSLKHFLWPPCAFNLPIVACVVKGQSERQH